MGDNFLCLSLLGSEGRAEAETNSAMAAARCLLTPANATTQGHLAER